MLVAGAQQPGEELPLAQTSRADMPVLRKRQSFSFGDNRLGPAMLADQAQTNTHPVIHSAAAAALESSPRSGAVGVAADSTVKHLGPVSSLPRSPAGGPNPALSQTAQSQVATQPGIDGSRVRAVKMSWAAAESGDSGKPEAGKGRPAAKAGSTAAPAAAGSAKAPAGTTRASGQAAALKSPKPARPHKADWQH